MKIEKKFFWAKFLFMAAWVLFAASGAAAQSVLPVGQSGGWQLTFEDNFDGAALDTAKWQPQDLWCGIRNNELQAYQPANARVSGGLLHLVAEKRAANLGYCGVPSISKNYASGIVITMDKFDQQYGYFEAKAKVPKGRGLWPAFWMMPYRTWPPEIDIMEILGHDTSTTYMTNHWGNASTPQKNGSSFSGIDFSADFHVFGAKWTSSEITWYVDGVQKFRSTSGIPNQPFFMMLNLAVGGNWPGSPDSSTYFPSELQVDYVRAWRPVSCSGDCPAAGEKRCDGNAVQTCELSGGCLKWGAAVNCAGGQNCESGVCRKECVSATCASLEYNCGEVSDGCGKTLNCGTCPAGQICQNGSCQNQYAVCSPGTVAGCKVCQSDGLGWKDEDSYCPTGRKCLNGVCTNRCVPKTCRDLGYFCGRHYDGCGKNLDCGGCDIGKTCYNGICENDYAKDQLQKREEILNKVYQMKVLLVQLLQQLLIELRKQLG